MNIIPYNIDGAKGKYLYKFLSEKYLLDFLRTGKIWFARSDKFGDKMECVMINDLKLPVPDFNKIESRKRKHLISCLHIGDHETLAFWDTYCRSDKSRRKYALRFRTGYLIQTLEQQVVEPKGISGISSDFIYGNVKYKNLIGVRGDKLNSSKVKYPAFRKESAFSYEKEYRFVFRLKEEFKKSGIGITLGEANSIKFDILVNPLLETPDYISALMIIKSNGFEDKWRLTPITRWVKPEVWKVVSNKK